MRWIFNKENHINLVISDADYLIDKPAEEIYKMCVGELIKYTKLKESDFSHYKVLKEKRATFVPSNKINYIRPSSNTKIANLFLAGDWSDTGLPSTIESAVKRVGDILIQLNKINSTDTSESDKLARKLSKEFINSVREGVTGRDVKTGEAEVQAGNIERNKKSIKEFKGYFWLSMFRKVLYSSYNT